MCYTLWQVLGRRQEQDRVFAFMELRSGGRDSWYTGSADFICDYSFINAMKDFRGSLCDPNASGQSVKAQF